MINMAPTLPPAETSAVFNLLALIANPASAEQRLKEIKAAHDDAATAYADLQTETAAFHEAKGKADAIAALQAHELEQREADLAKRGAAVESAEKMVADREAMDREISAKLEERVKDLNTREADVYARETAAEAAHTEIEAKKQWLADAEADYQARIAKLKELTA